MPIYTGVRVQVPLRTPANPWKQGVFLYLKAIRRKIDHMQFIHLDSIDDERVSAYTNLTEIQLRNKLEPSKGLFIAESPKVIDRALTADREPISLLVEEPWIGGMSETFARIDQRWGHRHSRVRGIP